MSNYMSHDMLKRREENQRRSMEVGGDNFRLISHGSPMPATTRIPDRQGDLMERLRSYKAKHALPLYYQREFVTGVPYSRTPHKRKLTPLQEELHKSMTNLNRSFLRKCSTAVEIPRGGDPGCSLVPIVMNYVSHNLNVILHNEEQFPSDKDLFSFLDDIESSIATLSLEMRSIRQRHNLLYNIKRQETPAKISAVPSAMELGEPPAKASPVPVCVRAVSAQISPFSPVQSISVPKNLFINPNNPSGEKLSKFVDYPATPMEPKSPKPKNLFSNPNMYNIPEKTSTVHLSPPSTEPKPNFPATPPNLFDSNIKTNTGFSGFQFTTTTTESNNNLIKLPSSMTSSKLPPSFPLPMSSSTPNPSKPQFSLPPTFGSINSGSSNMPNHNLTFGMFANANPSKTVANHVTPITNAAARNGGDVEDDDDEDDKPPVNEFKKVEEDNVVLEKRIKLYERDMKDSKFKDLGLGTLFVKELKYGHQLVVRAENNLGTILLNIFLNADVPMNVKGNSVLTVDPFGNDGKGQMYLLRVKTIPDAEALKMKLDELKSGKGKGSVNNNNNNNNSISAKNASSS